MRLETDLETLWRITQDQRETERSFSRLARGTFGQCPAVHGASRRKPARPAA